MKKAVILSVFIVVSAAVAADQTCVIKVNGMTCNGCASKIKSALENIEGIKSAEVSLASRSATVVYDDAVVNQDKMIKTVDDLGYKASSDVTSPRSVTDSKLSEAKSESPQVSIADKNASKIAIPGAESGKPVAQEMAGISEKASETEAVAAEKSETAEHHCAALKSCKEINEFHEAMHPLAMAIGFEGDEEKDYEFVRRNYPELKAKAVALSKMKIDDKLVTDRKAFENKRKALIKAVDDFGAAVKKNDHAMMDRTFEIMHQAYIDLAMTGR